MNNNTKINTDTKSKKNNQAFLKELLEDLVRSIKAHEIETKNNLIELENEETAELSLINELNQRVELFGLEHPYSMHVFNVLGRLYSDKKDFKGMVNLLKRSLKSRICKLGVDHPETLFTMNKLGRKLAICEEYEEAEQMFRKSLEGFNSLLGADHHITIRCQNDLKRLLKIQSYDSSIK